MTIARHAEPAAREDALLPAPFRVADRRQETHDTWTLRLEPTGDPLERFQPGQFAMLYAFGAGEVPISISGDLTGDGRPLVHTVRAVGAVTRSICSLREGDTVGARGPYGTAWPLAHAEGRDVVIVAGGIGLAPLRPVIYDLVANRDRYGSVSILYGGRSPAELLYVDELERWRGRFDVGVEVAVDTAQAGWRGRVGVVTTLIPPATFDPGNAVAMVCGPEVMMRFAGMALADAGLPDSAIWLSLERSMKCAVGFCGHCQLGPLFVCKDGPVFRRSDVARWMEIREL
jgi:NAD(P)H-flavin reductase